MIRSRALRIPRNADSAGAVGIEFAALSRRPATALGHLEAAANMFHPEVETLVREMETGSAFPRAAAGANAELAAVGRRKAAPVPDRIAARRPVDQRLGSESRSHRGRPETAGLAAVAADGPRL